MVRRRYYSRGFRGYSRAQTHISQAAAFSESVSGTDKIVKDYFLSLPSSRLNLILKDYGRKYGVGARDYAESVYPRWKSGATKMSGMVSERLFNLLPPRMQPEEKFQLVETLWNSQRRSTHMGMRVGLDVSPQEIVGAFGDYVARTAEAISIPAELEQRFSWLAGPDVALKQQLLNRVVEQESCLAAEAIRLQTPILLNLITEAEGELQATATQTVKFGSHQLSIKLDKSAKGIEFVHPQDLNRRPGIETSGKVGCILTIVVAVALLWFWSLSHHG